MLQLATNYKVLSKFELAFKVGVLSLKNKFGLSLKGKKKERFSFTFQPPSNILNHKELRNLGK